MAYFNSASLGIFFGLGLLALSGCGEGEGESLFGDGQGNGAADAGTGGNAGECSAGTTQACECTENGETRPGTRACYGGRWFDCNCPSEAPPPVVLEGDCKAGRYEGDFSGIYTSGFTFVGVPIPVFALDATGAPGLAFTLNKNVEASTPEFEIFTISDGYVKGTADGLFPFEAKLTGTLDCTTKTFTGTMKGGYCVTLCAGVNEAEFEGPVTGVYDSNGFQFTGGTWDLTEVEGNGGLFGEYGGSGEWNAVWVGEGSVDIDSGVTTVGDGGVSP